MAFLPHDTRRYGNGCPGRFRPGRSSHQAWDRLGRQTKDMRDRSASGDPIAVGAVTTRRKGRLRSLPLRTLTLASGKSAGRSMRWARSAQEMGSRWHQVHRSSLVSWRRGSDIPLIFLSD